MLFSPSQGINVNGATACEASGDGVTANEVTANEVTVNALTANGITANRVTANRITANWATACARMRYRGQASSYTMRYYLNIHKFI